MKIQLQTNRQRNHFEIQIFLVQASSGKNCTQGKKHQMKDNPSFDMVIFFTAIATPLLFQFTQIYSIKHTLIHLCAFHTLCFIFHCFHFTFVSRCANKQMSTCESLLLQLAIGKGRQAALCQEKPEKYICDQIPDGHKCSSLFCWLETLVSQQPSPIHKSVMLFLSLFSLFSLNLPWFLSTQNCQRATYTLKPENKKEP